MLITSAGKAQHMQLWQSALLEAADEKRWLPGCWSLPSKGSANPRGP